MPSEKKIIVRIAEGLGNQLFMYANGLALSKKNQASLYIDNESGFFKKKNKLRSRKYNLDIFSTNINICNSMDKFNSYPKDIIRKILKKLDSFKSNKLFLIDKTINGKSSYKAHNHPFNDRLYVEGHFETENYFNFLKSHLQSTLLIDEALIDKKNKFIKLLKSCNSVSIHIRRHRFSEENDMNKKKSDEFTKKIIEYIFRSVDYFKNKIDNPKFFIWSNDFKDLNEYFDNEDFTFIKDNDIANDFYLLSLSKHFIVGASTFHWWGAWLNSNPDKICTRPKDEILNPSNNRDFWPIYWEKI
ncbi:alpha-1,2-fucosyltransferase [Candidatus Pelagibacter sp. Uisw_130]|uniref:alpha-1,2-fucosyltransferase n=1 Tax=Candidatus Pelagibacter sp. Uisw_130 TaxID=3230989 RepID=UPI0039ED9A4B